MCTALFCLEFKLWVSIFVITLYIILRLGYVLIAFLMIFLKCILL